MAAKANGAVKIVKNQKAAKGSEYPSEVAFKDASFLNQYE